MGILFASVTGYELAGFTMEETQCWGISQEYGCSRGHVHDIRFRDTNKMLNQDGVDVRKGCHDIVISNVVETADAAKGEPTCKATLRIGDRGYWSIRCCEMGEMSDITVRDVKSASKVGVLIRGMLADSSICGITVPAGAEKYRIDAPIRNVRLDER